MEEANNVIKDISARAHLMSGCEGYIANNRKYYGFAGSYKVLIKIGNNVKVEYTKYKEKDVMLWSKVGKFAKGLWQFCSYLFVPQWGKHKNA